MDRSPPPQVVQSDVDQSQIDPSQIEWSPGRVVLRDEIDMDLSLILRRALEAAATLDGSGIVGDVSELKFIDSCGLNE